MPTTDIAPGTRVKMLTNLKDRLAHLRGDNPDEIHGVILERQPDGRYLVCFSFEDFTVNITKYPDDLILA